MDIDKASSPVSDISILSRTPTPPLTSPEDLMGIPTSEQDVGVLILDRKTCVY